VPPESNGEIDLGRMRRARVEKVRAAMISAGVETIVCCGQANVSYLTGALVPAADHARASSWRSVAVFGAGDDAPLLLTAFPEGAPDGTRCDDWRAVETDAGARALAAELPPGPVAIDDAPFPLWAALGDRDACDAGPVLGAAKLTKTEDELNCIARAQAVNERAIDLVRPLAQPGVPATTLSGAFLDAIAELGATANTVDPVFQVMVPSVEGEPRYPEPTRPPPLRAGDVIWVDTGMHVHGYASDFGATWIVGRPPNRHERDQFARWREVVDRALGAVRPGATAADLVRAAGLDRGRRPWLSYFYLAHGIGTDSAEMPFVGTDLGPSSTPRSCSSRGWCSSSSRSSGTTATPVTDPRRSSP
jgi:Xaa-Pro aminopeptidase